MISEKGPRVVIPEVYEYSMTSSRSGLVMKAVSVTKAVCVVVVVTVERSTSVLVKVVRMSTVVVSV